MAVDDLNFEVSAGTVTALIGPNGAGKTTTINAITGFVRPTSGKVSFEGRPITSLPAYEVARLGIIRTFQRTAVFPHLTVLANVLIGQHRLLRASVLDILLGRQSVRAEEDETRRRALAALERVGLAYRADEPAGSLPYGEQRLLGIAIALSAEPRLLLLDEPAAGLTHAETYRLAELIRALPSQGITVLLVEHKVRMVMAISDRVVVVAHGRKVAEGSPQEVARHPEVIRVYLGDEDVVA